MDPRLLDYYNQELQHIREGAAEFAREFPKIASRLALETTNAQGECVDPYVERLLEGFAFLTARIQIKIDAEHARFTQALLEMVYPGYLAPVPSAIIARITPDHGEPGLAEGFRLPRGSVLSTRLEPGAGVHRFVGVGRLRLRHDCFLGQMSGRMRKSGMPVWADSRLAIAGEG